MGGGPPKPPGLLNLPVGKDMTDENKLSPLNQHDKADPCDYVPLPVLDFDVLHIVNIPRMSMEAFDFFTQQLQVYKRAITRDAPLPAGAMPGSFAGKNIDRGLAGR